MDILTNCVTKNKLRAFAAGLRCEAVSVWRNQLVFVLIRQGSAEDVSSVSETEVAAKSHFVRLITCQVHPCRVGSDVLNSNFGLNVFVSFVVDPGGTQHVSSAALVYFLCLLSAT